MNKQETTNQANVTLSNEHVFGHLMLDIETMGNESFSSILSIGALEFDIETGNTGREFYVNVDLQSCLDLGLIVNASTIMWWLRQNEQARKDLTERQSIPIRQALMEFAQFCNKDYQIWGNSARFDCGILQNAYNKAGILIPWDFRKERCVRTLVSFNPEIKDGFTPIGTAHNALSDCYFQVGYCSAIWAYLHCKK
jgi:DNA polymerase III epsilon subunit-like protein